MEMPILIAIKAEEKSQCSHRKENDVATLEPPLNRIREENQKDDKTNVNRVLPSHFAIRSKDDHQQDDADEGEIDD